MAENIYKAPITAPPRQKFDDSYTEPADPLERFLGNAVDGFVLVFPLVVLFTVLVMIAGTSVGDLPRAAIQIGVFGPLIVAQAAFEASRWQATPGKRWQGMRVYTTRGKAPAFWRTLVRNAFKWILLALFPPIGLFAYLDPQRRMPWDRLAGTVVREQPNDEEDLDEDVVYLDIE